MEWLWKIIEGSAYGDFILEVRSILSSTVFFVSLFFLLRGVDFRVLVVPIESITSWAVIELPPMLDLCWPLVVKESKDQGRKGKM
jgi:hypothetical protein